VTLSDRHASINQRLEALGRTVASLRARVALDPATLPELAAEVNNLAVDLAEAGSTGEALTSAREAVERYRELVRNDRDTHLLAFAISMNNLTLRLAEAGRPHEGLGAAREAVRLHRELFGLRGEAHLPGLAGALNTLAVYSSRVRRVGEALINAREAVTLHRGLLRLDRDNHLLNAAASLDTLAATQTTLGDRVGAVTAAREAVTLLHELNTLIAQAPVAAQVGSAVPTDETADVTDRLTEATERFRRLSQIPA
jgi:tetratricopeptide (TPR) repeat protein